MAPIKIIRALRIEYTPTAPVLCTLVSGRAACATEVEIWSGSMLHTMKEIGSIIKHVAKESSSILMVTSMTASG